MTFRSRRGFSLFGSATELDTFDLTHQEQSKKEAYIEQSGQTVIVYKPRFPWNKRFPLLNHHLGVRLCEVAVIWPEHCNTSPIPIWLCGSKNTSQSFHNHPDVWNDHFRKMFFSARLERSAWNHDNHFIYELNWIKWFCTGRTDCLSSWQHGCEWTLPLDSMELVWNGLEREDGQIFPNFTRSPSIVLCSTEKYFVVQSSTGVALCSTE